MVEVGLGGLVFGLVESSRSGFEGTLTVGALIVGVIALETFSLVEHPRRKPGATDIPEVLDSETGRSVGRAINEARSSPSTG